MSWHLQPVVVDFGIAKQCSGNNINPDLPTFNSKQASTGVVKSK